MCTTYLIITRTVYVFPVIIVENVFFFFVRYKLDFRILLALMSDFIERAMAQAVIRRPLKREGPGSIPGHSVCVLWWTAWLFYRFFSRYFGFTLSLSFHQCSILIFTYVLHLPSSLGTFQIARLFRMSGAEDRKLVQLLLLSHRLLFFFLIIATPILWIFDC